VPRRKSHVEDFSATEDHCQPCKMMWPLGGALLLVTCGTMFNPHPRTEILAALPMVLPPSVRRKDRTIETGGQTAGRAPPPQFLSPQFLDGPVGAS
jgi:hypothetical protein